MNTARSWCVVSWCVAACGALAQGPSADGVLLLPPAAVGVEQNIPADQATPAGGAGEQTKKQNERREELTNYEVSSKTISTVSEGYKVDQLTVAVVINRKRLLAALGEGAGQEAHTDSEVSPCHRPAA